MVHIKGIIFTKTLNKIRKTNIHACNKHWKKDFTLVFINNFLGRYLKFKKNIMESEFVQTARNVKKKREDHTCINRAPREAQEASSFIEPTQNLKAAQSTNAKP